MQRAKRLIVGDGFVSGKGLGHQVLFRNECDYGIQSWVHAGDLAKVSLHQLADGKTLLADQSRELDGGKETEFFPLG